MGFVIQVLLQNSYVVIETIFFGSIEDIKIVDLHVHGSIQFSDADISFIKIYTYGSIHIIFLIFTFQDGVKHVMGSFKSQEIQGINDETNYFSSGWLYFFVIHNKWVVTVCGCRSDLLWTL